MASLFFRGSLKRLCPPTQRHTGRVSLPSLICTVTHVKVDTVVCSHRVSKRRGVENTVIVVGRSLCQRFSEGKQQESFIM